MSIPTYVTHTKPAPPSAPEKKTKEPPSVERLKLLLLNDGQSIVEEFIKEFNLPYKIDNGMLKDKLAGTDLWLSRFITVHPATLAMLDDVRLLAKCDDEVLITGETGTGKETIANAMIGLRSGPCVTVNCAGLPDQLIESELFGHERGAFTGAEAQKKGLMSVAQDGVLFLDEIGELPLSVQGKLLRALQYKKVRKVGSNKEEDINCKFVCATNKNIKQMVTDGLFRQDLYARISTFELHIQSLKERDCDVVPIIEGMKGGKDMLGYMKSNDIHHSRLDTTHNVRSLQQYCKRWSVFGRVSI